MAEFGHKKQPGDRSLQAGAWNRMVAKTTRPDVQPPNVVNNPRDYDLTQLENASGSAQDPFAVLEVSNATWEERNDALFDSEGMRRGVEIQGDTPSDEWQATVIAQKSVPSGSFTGGVVSGPTPCRVLYNDQASLDYPYAIPIPGDPTKLMAAPYGLHRILWHEEAAPMDGCDPQTLQTYLNMGEDGQWVFFKLQDDMPCCGSVSGLLVDQCGSEMGDCPIYRTVWSPMCLQTCTCDNEVSTNTGWKAGDVVPCWWYQYLEKWVTIPYFDNNYITQQLEPLTNLSLDLTKWNLRGETPRVGTVAISGNTTVEGTLTGTALAEGTASLNGEITVDGTLETTGTATVSGVTTVSGPVDVAGVTTVSGPVDVAGTVSLETTNETVITSVESTPPNLTWTDSSISIPSGTATVSGTLNVNGTTTTIPVSTTIPLQQKTIITGISLNGCELTYTTENIWVPIANSATVTVSGTFALPTEVTGTAVLSSGSSVNVSKINTWAPGGVTSQSGTLAIPTSATANITGNATLSGQNTMTGTATLSGQNTMTGTVEIESAATVSGTITGTPQATLDLSTVEITGVLSGTIEAEGACVVMVPNRIELDDDAITLTRQPIEFLRCPPCEE